MDEKMLLQAIGQMMDEKLDSRLKPIQDDISSMKGDIVAMKGDIVAMKGDIVAMKGDIVALKHGQEEMRSDIVVMKDDIVAMKGDIVSLKDRQDALEANVYKHIDESEQRMKVYIETNVSKVVGVIMDGHADLDRRLYRIEDYAEKYEELHNTVAVLKQVAEQR